MIPRAVAFVVLSVLALQAHAAMRVDVRSFGALLDGSSNDVAALRRALAAVDQTGGEVLISGRAALASADLPLALASNVALVFEGPDAGIVVTGDAPNNLFVAHNRSKVSIRGGRIRGNGRGIGPGTGAALFFTQDDAARAPGGEVEISGVTFENFGGDYWLYFLNTGDRHVLRNIRVHHNRVRSWPGNSRAPASIGAGAYFVVFQGASTNRSAVLEDFEVADNEADCRFIKGFAVAWQGTRRGRLLRNTITEAGRYGAQDNAAAYAFMAYDNSDGRGLAPDELTFEGNVVYAPRSAALYVASGGRIEVRNNVISRQSDTQDTSLPKGAIVFNSARDVLVTGNRIDDSFGGIVLMGGSSRDSQIAENNTIRNVRSGGFGIRLVTTFEGKTALQQLSGNSIVASASDSSAVLMQYAASRGVARLVLRGNTQLRAPTCLLLQSVDGSSLDLSAADLSDAGSRSVTARKLARLRSGEDSSARWRVCR